MNRKLKRQFKKRIILGSIIMIVLAVVIGAVSLSIKIAEVHEQEQRLDEMYTNKYQIDLSSLNFLSDKEKNAYKKKVVQACEAYDLVKLKKIVIDESSIKLYQDANMYDWIIYCDDSKNTAFLCAYKTVKKTFTIERQYDKEVVTANEIEKKNTKNKSSTSIKTKTVNSGEYSACKVGKIIYPEDCDVLKSSEQQNEFNEGICEYLGYNGISTVSKVEFEKYNDYSGEIDKMELEFNIYESAPSKINELSAVYDAASGWEYAILY